MSGARFLTPAELRELGRVSTLKGVAAIVWTWAWIAGAIALYCWRPAWWTFALGWLIVSSRHLALAVLMHEGAHRLIAKDKRLNDALANWLTAYPIMLNVEVYRMIHLQHHKATWTDADPDLGLAKPFPISKRSLLRKVVRDLTGRTGLARYRLIAGFSAGSPPSVKTFLKNQRGFLLTNALLFALLAFAGRPEAYVLLWLLPALTGYSLVLRLRSIAEHAVVSDPADELRQTRTTLAPFWLRFWLAPHNVNYHLEHHLFMFVPHYNLPKAHRRLRELGVLERAEVAPSYWEVLRRATSAAG